MDDYLDGVPAEQSAALAAIRGVIAEAVPDAEEGTSYGIPAFLYQGRPLAGFRAGRNHLSLFPFSPAAIEAVKERLEGFDVSKGTIRFSPDHPLPDDVVREVVMARLGELTGG